MGKYIKAIAPCEDGEIEIYDTDSNLLDTVTIPSGTTVPTTIGNSTAVLKDTGGNTLSTTPILAEGSDEIIAPDSSYTISDEGSNTLYSGSILSNGSLSQQIANSTFEVKKSDGVTIYTDSILAEGNGSRNVSDSVVILEDTDNNTLSTTNVKATDSATIIAPDGTVNIVDSNLDPIGSQIVASGGTETYVVSALPCGGGTPSGIAYQEPNISSISSVIYADYDAAWRSQNNAYRNVKPINPLYEQELDFNSVDPFNTLLHNNIHGNKHRFTDSAGLATAFTTGVEFQDHLIGRYIYCFASYGGFKSWVDFLQLAHNEDPLYPLGNSYFAPSMDEFWSLKTTKQSEIIINGGVVPIDSNYRNWTCNIDESNTANAMRMNASRYPIEPLAITNTTRGGFMVRLFHPISNP